MKKTTVRPSALLQIPLLAAVLLLSGGILRYPTLAAAGARNGLSLCAGVVIPTLFPFLVLCSFSVRSGLCLWIERPLAPVTKCLFRLPGRCACAIVMGCIGGYPAGLRVVSQMRQDAMISQDQAFRLSLFCINAGPAFVLGTVGSVLLGNRTAGWILWGSLTAASLLLGVLTRFLSTHDPNTVPIEAKKDATDRQAALIASVTDSAGAMLSMCAWIVLCSSFCALLPAFSLPDDAVMILRCVTEVTDGCKTAAGIGAPLPIFAAILAFSGCSVLMQILPLAKECGVRLSVLIVSRIVAAVLAALICKQLCLLFPSAVTASLPLADRAWSLHASSAPASAGLLLMCALLILDAGGMTEIRLFHKEKHAPHKDALK